MEVAELVTVLEEACRYFGAEPGRLQLLKHDWHLIDANLSLTQFTYLLSLHAGGSGMARFHAKHLLSAIIQLHSDIDCSDSNADGTIAWDAFNRELIRHATSAAPARPGDDYDRVQPLGRLPLEMTGDDFAPGPHRTTIDRVVVLDPPLELLLCEHVPVANGRAKSRYLDPRGEPSLTFHLSLWRLTGASLQRARVIAENSALLSCATMVSSTQLGRSTTLCEMALATTSAGAQVWSISATGRVMVAKLVKELSTPRPLLCLACERVGRATRRMLFGGDVAGSVLVWDCENWVVRQTIAAHDGAVSGLHLLPSLDALVTVSHDRKLRVWDLLEERARLQPCGGERWHRGPLVGVAYCRVHQLVVSVSDDRTAVVMNPALGELLCSLTGHAYPIVSVALTPDAIITADARRYVCVWELSSLICVQKFRISSPGLPAEDSTLAAAVTLRTGPPLLLALVDGGFHLFGIIDTSRERREAPAALLYSQKHSYVVSAGGHMLQVWDARTGALLKSLRSLTESPISAACLDHTEYNCLVGTQDGSVLQFNLSVATLVRALPAHRTEITALALVSSAAVGRAKMAGLSSRKVLNEEALHGALLVSASNDRTLHLSSVRQGCLLVAFQIGAGNLSCLATFPHVGLIATGSSSGTLSLWTVLNATAVRQDSRCDGHGSEVTALAFLGDSGLLASADANAELVLWGVAAQRFTPLRRLRHRGVQDLGTPLVATALAFETGRELLCTADEAGVVNVWSLMELGLGGCGEGDGGAAEPAAAAMAGPLLAGLEGSEVEPVAVWAAHEDVALCLVAIGGDAMEPGSQGSFALLSASRDCNICAWLIEDDHDAPVERRLCGSLSTGWALPLDLTRMLEAEEELRATLVSELRAFDPPDGLSVFEQGHLLHQYIQTAEERARRKAWETAVALVARGGGNGML